jgi:glycosyltransferase involved in cell wall biosynthesis
MAIIPRKPNGKKWNLLYYGDLGAPTGFNTVSKNILKGLYDTGLFEIVVLAINNWGEPIPEQKFYKIYPASNNPQNDPYGLSRLHNMIVDTKIDFDIFFSLQDTFILQDIPRAFEMARANGKKFVNIAYFPIDGTPKEKWIKAMHSYDVPVVYTKFGYDQCIKVFPPIAEKLSVIPHGIEFDDFYYIESRDYVKDFKAKFFSGRMTNDSFLFLRIDRNQRRKDYPRTFMAFKEFLKYREAVLYCHCMVEDVGWNLVEVAKSVGLEVGKNVLFPGNYSVTKGLPIDVVNRIYNAADCVVSTTTGGGWELCVTEAMATKTPVLMPRNTALTEIVGANEERGWLANSGSNINLFTILQSDEEVLRPLTDINHMVEKMIYIYDHRDEAQAKAEKAHAWLNSTLRWKEHIIPVWLDIIGSAVGTLLTNTPKSETAVLTRSI